MRPVNVNATYTGGNIWLFCGSLEDKNYFLCSDDGFVLFLNADAEEDFDTSLFEEWQNEHLIKELEGEERKRFCNDMLDLLEKDPNGGITRMEIDAYRKWFQMD